MYSRARVLGHPLHPMLVVFPLGLLITAVVFDLIYLLTHNATFSQVGFWNITAGLIGALLAAPAGLMDWAGIQPGTRAKRIGRVHAAGNAIVVVLFLVSWLARLGRSAHAIGGGLFVLEVIALIIAGIAAWFGGELVDRLGIGVDADAHPNAPSSLGAPRARSGAANWPGAAGWRKTRRASKIPPAGP